MQPRLRRKDPMNTEPNSSQRVTPKPRNRESQPPKKETIDGNRMLAFLSEFVGRYLSCTPDQRTLLALWIVHTYCFRVAPVSPYLNIYSHEKQSGKTLCLELLRLVCAAPFHATGMSPVAVIQQFKNQKFKEAKGDPGITLLLDDTHLTFGSSSQSRALQALLLAGGRRNGFYRYRQGTAVYPLQPYAPKAFAGSAALPAALVDLSIPIALAPKPSGSLVRRFRVEEAEKLALPLRQLLDQWTNDNLHTLEKRGASSYPEDQFPSELSPRQQDCVEPLLLIADLVGGDWPSSVRRALVNVFTAQDLEGQTGSLQLLFDIREAFLHSSNPDRISTEDLLAFLHTLDDRNWDDWDGDGPLTPRGLSRLLSHFEISSRTLRISPDSRAKGFCRDDFEAAWKRYLPPPNLGPAAAVEVSRQTPDLQSTDLQSTDPQNPGRQNPDLQDPGPGEREEAHPPMPPVTDETPVPEHSSVPQIANKIAPCHDVTDKLHDFDDRHSGPPSYRPTGRAMHQQPEDRGENPGLGETEEPSPPPRTISGDQSNQRHQR